MDTPTFPCTLDHVHRPDGAGCSSPVIPEEAYRTALAMRHHARGDALEYLGAPAPHNRNSDGSAYWKVDGIAIGGYVEDGEPWVDINFPSPDDDNPLPAYVWDGNANQVERWLLAALAAVHDARAQASMEVQ